MSAIGDLVALLASTGLPPDKMKAILDLTQEHAVECQRVSADVYLKSGGNRVDETAERRRKWDRERKAAERAAEREARGNSTGQNADAPSYLSSLPSSSLSSEFPEEGKEERGDARARGAKNGTCLSDTWKPNDGHLAEALRLGMDRAWMLAQADDMRLWANANRNRAIARKADWDMTFTVWMRRNAKTGPPRVNGHHVAPAPRPGSREDRAERTANALAELRRQAGFDTDEQGRSGPARDDLAGFLPLPKPAGS